MRWSTSLEYTVSTKIEYKRESFFRGVNLKNAFKMDCSNYYLLVHENIKEYDLKLKSLVHI